MAKAAATLYSGMLARTGRLPALTLRLYSVFGPWEDPRRFVPRLVASGLEGRLPPLATAGAAHDFVWIDDVVDALVAAARRAPEAPAGAVYNVGTGRQVTLAEAVEAARRVLGVEAEPVWGSAPSRDWDATVWRADPARSTAELGWTAATRFDTGLERMAVWLRDTPAVARLYGLRGAVA